MLKGGEKMEEWNRRGKQRISIIDKRFPMGANVGPVISDWCLCSQGIYTWLFTRSITVRLQYL
jgi:hypothetical protein